MARWRLARLPLAATFEHPKVLAPRTHGLPVLMGRNAGNLVEMSQVVRRPGRQQLRKSHDAKVGMSSAPFEILFL